MDNKTILKKKAKMQQLHKKYQKIVDKINRDGYSMPKQEEAIDKWLNQMLLITQEHQKQINKSTNQQINKEVMATKRKSTRSKRAQYSKSTKTIYKDGKNTIQVVIKKAKSKKRKNKK